MKFEGAYTSSYDWMLELEKLFCLACHKKGLTLVKYTRCPNWKVNKKCEFIFRQWLDLPSSQNHLDLGSGSMKKGLLEIEKGIVS